jgi:hypothetical protein
MSELEKSQASVPDLVRTPALEITAEDVALPRLYVGQFMSQAVQDGLVKPGDVYVADGADDPSPEVLWAFGSDSPGALVHVLSLRKGKSAQVDGDLELYDYDDPAAPEDAWVTYNYIVALPEVDAEVPAKWLLTRTGRPTAQRINTVIKRNEATAPAFAHAFRVKTVERKNEKGRFYVPAITVVDAQNENLAVAEKLAVSLAPRLSLEAAPTGDQPAI